MYSFIDRYCQLTANIPEMGVVTFTGWITLADDKTLLILDEYHNPNLVKREHLIGSIVVLERQREYRIIKEKELCEIGN